jgi:hypothetical protein
VKTQALSTFIDVLKSKKRVGTKIEKFCSEWKVTVATVEVIVGEQEGVNRYSRRNL